MSKPYAIGSTTNKHLKYKGIISASQDLILGFRSKIDSLELAMTKMAG
jgi:hypothetical protein